MPNADTITRAQALTILAERTETRCDVYCLPNVVVAIVGGHWLRNDELNAMEKDGLVKIRLEEIPCPPMGARTPPIRHVSLTDAGRLATSKA